MTAVTIHPLAWIHGQQAFVSAQFLRVFIFKNLDSWDAGKVQLLLLTSSMHPDLNFFALTVWWNLSVGLLDFHKDSSVGDCLNEYSPVAPRLWLRWANVSSQATSGSHARTEVCVPITQRMGETPPGPLGCGYGSHSSPEGTFVCDWMPNCYCRGGIQAGESYSVVLLTATSKITLTELSDIKLMI